MKLLYEIIEDTKAIFKSSNTERIKEDEIPSIWKYLPYDTYNGELFENKGSIGFILKASHFSGFTEQKEEILSSFLNYEVPKDYYIEVINYASPKIGKIISNWKSNSSNLLYQKLTTKRIEHICGGNWTNILGNKGTHIFRDFHLYFIISAKEDKYSLLRFKEKLNYTLKRLGCSTSDVTGADLASFLSELLTPDTSPYSTDIKKEDGKRIEDYIAADSRIIAQKDSIKVVSNNSEFIYLVFEVVEFPEDWEMSESFNLMENFEHGVRLPFPFLIRYGIRFFGSEESKRRANRARTIKLKQGDTEGVFKYFPQMIEEVQDWDFVNSCLDKGQKLAKGIISIVAMVQNDVESAIQSIKSHFSELKFKLEQVNHETINSFISCLPFGFASFYESLDQLKAISTITSSTAKNLMPVFADHSNTASPLMLLSGRRGQLFYFDNFLSKENYNMVVIGKPGSGKSTFLNELTISTLKIGGQVVTLDDGHSAENLCSILQGAHIDFNTTDFCINPFTLFIEKGSIDDYVSDFEEPFIKLVTSILCVIMGVNVDEISPENTIYKSLMRKAITCVMAQKGKNGGFQDILAELQENPECKLICDEDIRERLIYALKEYAQGRYSLYFNGESKLDINNMLTVFEFSKINSNEVLKNSVLMMVTFLVYSKMFKRERRMVLIIDEAWSLLKHAGMREFMGAIARKARKYKGCIVIATQNYGDFSYEFSPVANEILSCSDWRIMAGADRSDEKYLENLFSLDIEIPLLRSVRGQKGLFSEYMIKHKSGGSDIARLFLEPFSKALYSSTAEDVQLLKAIKSQGFSTEEAIEKMICMI